MKASVEGIFRLKAELGTYLNDLEEATMTDLSGKVIHEWKAKDFPKKAMLIEREDKSYFMPNEVVFRYQVMRHTS